MVLFLIEPREGEDVARSVLRVGVLSASVRRSLERRDISVNGQANGKFFETNKHVKMLTKITSTHINCYSPLQF